MESRAVIRHYSDTDNRTRYAIMTDGTIGHNTPL